MKIDFDFNAFKETFLSYLQALTSFQFSALNPVLWVFVLIAFFILLRHWKIKKAFSFCVTVTIVLLITTKVEKELLKLLTQGGEVFDPVIVRVFSLFVLAAVVLYFVFIRGND